MRFVASVICTAGLTVCVGACDRPAPRAPPVVHVTVSEPFEGELVLLNRAGSPNPTSTAAESGVEVRLDPGRRNEYDATRWPSVYLLAASFADGSPISTTRLTDGAIYEMSVVSLDDRGNLRLRMTRSR